MKKFSLITAGVLTALAVFAGCQTAEPSNLIYFDTLENEAVSSDEENPSSEVSQTTENVPSDDTKEEIIEETGEETVDEKDTKGSTQTLEDGEYVATFTTDSSMFHVNETLDDKGTLTVKDGEMYIHVTLASKLIINLYPGLAEDAAKDGAVLLEPTVDTVTYEDGLTEEVYGFDVPVPGLDEEFDLALIGTKGKWYNHKVQVSLAEEGKEEAVLEDGEYTIEVTLEGGTGRASITSPCRISVKDGSVIATIEWSSPNYDYMVLDGDMMYNPVNTEGNSVFEIPVNINEPNEVVADTTAMSKPHEIEYVITFDAGSVKAAE